jgi:hypothetical protein
MWGRRKNERLARREGTGSSNQKGDRVSFSAGGGGSAVPLLQLPGAPDDSALALATAPAAAEAPPPADAATDDVPLPPPPSLGQLVGASLRARGQRARKVLKRLVNRVVSAATGKLPDLEDEIEDEVRGDASPVACSSHCPGLFFHVPAEVLI